MDTTTRRRTGTGRAMSEHSASRYGNGYCRCARCRHAHTTRGKLRRAGLAQPLLLDATGSRRRLEGLFLLGHTYDQITEAAGFSVRSRVSGVRSAQKVTRDTAAKVRRAVAKLGNKPGTSDRTRRAAERAGYVPLDLWIDIDDPAEPPPPSLGSDYVDDAKLYQLVASLTQPDPPAPADLNLSRAEKIAAVRRLAAPPYRRSDGEIARRIGTNEKFVAKHRDAAGIPRVYASRPRKKKAAA